MAEAKETSTQGHEEEEFRPFSAFVDDDIQDEALNAEAEIAEALDADSQQDSGRIVSSYGTYGYRKRSPSYRASHGKVTSSFRFGAPIHRRQLLILADREPICHFLVWGVAKDIFRSWFRVVPLDELPDPVLDTKFQQIITDTDMKKAFFEAAGYCRRDGWAVIAFLDDDKAKHGIVAEAFQPDDIAIQWGQWEPVAYELYRRVGDQGASRISVGVLPAEHVIHISTRPGVTPYFGKSVIEPIFDDIVILRNIRWSMGQTMFRYGGGFPDITVKSDGRNVSEDYIRDLMAKYKDFSARTAWWHDENLELNFKGASGATLDPRQYHDPLVSHIAAATQVPEAILMGSPSGATATGEVNERGYFALLEGEQLTWTRYVLEALEYIAKHTGYAWEQKPLKIQWLLKYSMSELDKQVIDGSRTDQLSQMMATYATRREVRAEAGYESVPKEEMKDQPEDDMFYASARSQAIEFSMPEMFEGPEHQRPNAPTGQEPSQIEQTAQGSAIEKRGSPSRAGTHIHGEQHTDTADARLLEIQRNWDMVERLKRKPHLTRSEADHLAKLEKLLYMSAKVNLARVERQRDEQERAKVGHDDMSYAQDSLRDAVVEKLGQIGDFYRRQHPTWGTVIVFPKRVIAKEIVQEYPAEHRSMYKPAEEIERAVDFLRQFHAPISWEHPHTDTLTNFKEIVGYTDNEQYRDGRAIADLVYIVDKLGADREQALMLGQKPDVSIGFFYEDDRSSGVFDNVPYHGIQRNIYINHVATTTRGRCSTEEGCGLSVRYDSDLTQGKTFAYDSFGMDVTYIVPPDPDRGEPVPGLVARQPQEPQSVEECIGWQMAQGYSRLRAEEICGEKIGKPEKKVSPGAVDSASERAAEYRRRLAEAQKKAQNESSLKRQKVLEEWDKARRKVQELQGKHQGLYVQAFGSREEYKRAEAKILKELRVWQQKQDELNRQLQYGFDADITPDNCVGVMLQQLEGEDKPQDQKVAIAISKCRDKYGEGQFPTQSDAEARKAYIDSLARDIAQIALIVKALQNQ